MIGDPATNAITNWQPKDGELIQLELPPTTHYTKEVNVKQRNIKHESLASMNLWTLLPGNGAKFDRGRTRIK